MHPLAPFSEANPLLAWIPHDAVYVLCAMGVGLGALAWVLRKRMAKKAIF